jgi:hypothetical protein
LIDIFAIDRYVLQSIAHKSSFSDFFKISCRLIKKIQRQSGIVVIVSVQT